MKKIIPYIYLSLGVTVILILIFFSRIYDVYFKDDLFIKRNIAIFKEHTNAFNIVKDNLMMINDDVLVSINQGTIKVKGIESGDVAINEEFENQLNKLFSKCGIEKITYYRREEGKRVKFYVERTIKPKGILYVVESDENRIRDTLEHLDMYIHIGDNWFYFEEYPGT